MNKKKDKKNLKKIISITKAKSTNKFPINQKRQNNKIKHISNINLENEKNDYFKENIKNNEKRLEIIQIIKIAMMERIIMILKHILNIMI